MLFYSSNNAAGTSAKSPPTTCCAAFPLDAVADGAALVPEDGEFDVDVLLVLFKLVCVVMLAVTPVALVHTLGTEDAVPSTKFTAAHCTKSQQALKRSVITKTYLVQVSVNSSLSDLNYTSLTSKVGWHFQVGQAEISETTFGNDREDVGPVEWLGST